MPESELKKIAKDVAFIVKGYAFSLRNDGFVDALNIEHPECAMVVSRAGEIPDLEGLQ